MRLRLAGAVAASLFFCAAGCATRSAPATPAPKEPEDAVALVEIAIDVKGMTKALNIT
jgi:hypothetical protein